MIKFEWKWLCVARSSGEWLLIGDIRNSCNQTITSHLFTISTLSLSLKITPPKINLLEKGCITTEMNWNISFWKRKNARKWFIFVNSIIINVKNKVNYLLFASKQYNNKKHIICMNFSFKKIINNFIYIFIFFQYFLFIKLIKKDLQKQKKVIDFLYILFLVELGVSEAENSNLI